MDTEAVVQGIIRGVVVLMRSVAKKDVVLPVKFVVQQGVKKVIWLFLTMV